MVKKSFKLEIELTNAEAESLGLHRAIPLYLREVANRIENDYALNARVLDGNGASIGQYGIHGIRVGDPRKEWTYYGINVYPADINGSGIRWYANPLDYPNSGILRADTKECMKELIRDLVK
jgi:hypothetical protein